MSPVPVPAKPLPEKLNPAHDAAVRHMLALPAQPANAPNGLKKPGRKRASGRRRRRT